ncbi:MAG: ABC transporter permease [Chloroflexi bacterium]|jgi:ABC-2 type transport system permease protein|nr:ABC transporter permease [Chloroflexota bacterium]MBT3670097.1 ABC transporter permease [Chloroflexota bacterium]MBT4001737.1 ABC transporter permease [Chloroflexota bacterium]MBT4306701.1 ABC transporter permease [Chloroflexota bacterium]MBT4532983.1 ABC transporter permease [Chloroflexota bacterium]
MRIINLAIKDLTQLLREKSTFLFSLIMPIAFTFLFGFIFGGTGSSDAEDIRLPVGILVEDSDGYTSTLLAALEESDVFRLVDEDSLTHQGLSEQVADGDLEGGLIIPEGYGEQVRNGSPLSLTLIMDPSNSNGFSIEYSVSNISNRLLRSARTAQLSVAVFQDQSSFENDEAEMVFYNKSFDKAFLAWAAPAVTTVNTFTGQDQAEEKEDPFGENPYAHSSPGMMIQFAIAGLIGAAEIIVNERKTKSMQRLLTTSISRIEILLGHFLSMFTMIFTQIMILMIFGQFVLKLGYLNAPLASLLMAFTISLSVAALGLLVGALSKTPENAVVYSLIPMFVLSGLGGAWMPLEFTSETVQTVGHFTPVAWGMDGLKNILIRGQGLEATWLPAGMLLIFAAIFFGLAVWRFKFE